jgi:hypothetical protein
MIRRAEDLVLNELIGVCLFSVLVPKNITKK